MAETGTDIGRAAAILEEGGLVAIPTETVYGLAGNAMNSRAVARIFEVKNRPHFDPLICHYSSLTALEVSIGDLTNMEKRLLEVFSPGPLTLLVPKPRAIPDLITSGLPRVAVRIPAHPMTLSLLAGLPFPLAAPSANPFGYISPTLPAHVEAQLGASIDYILDGGPCVVGLESTVIQLLDNQHGQIVRPGGISIEQLQSRFPEVDWQLHNSTGGASSFGSPGMLESHYAPGKSLVLVQDPDSDPGFDVTNHFFIGLSETSSLPYKRQDILSSDGNLANAAARLFAVLRSADATQCAGIVAQIVPEYGLGRAINDRLRRAAAKRS